MRIKRDQFRFTSLEHKSGSKTVGTPSSASRFVDRTLREGSALRYAYGLIILDLEGHMETGKTDGVDALFYAWHDGRKALTFLD